MRYFLLIAACAGLAGAQSIAENAAAAAGGSVGGAAGKKVGEGIANIFNKVDKQAASAANASAASKSPLLEVGPGVPKSELVPPPPPPAGSAHRSSSSRRTQRASQDMEPALTPAAYSPAAISIPNIPPPPDIKLSDLQSLKAGTDRSTLLSLGTPGERITSFDDGHLMEVFHYMSGDRSLGVVQLTDGRVSNVILN